MGGANRGGGDEIFFTLPSEATAAMNFGQLNEPVHASEKSMSVVFPTPKC